ncbi:MAG: hypothetical protein ACRDWS_09420 [Acidimicrobiia bacterium]
MIRYLLKEDRLGGIAVALLAAAFFVASWPIWLNNTWFFDDYWACGLVESEGLAGTLHDYWTFMGLYRLVTVPYYALTGPLCDLPVLVKAIGLGLHVASGFALYALGRRRWGWGRAAALVSTAILVLNPLAFEAISWAAAIKHFPLALLLVIIGLDRLLAQPARIGTATLLFTGAVMALEQVILLVVVVPFVVIGTSFRQRLIGAAKVASPAVIYLLLVRLTGGLTTNPRLSGDEVPSPFNVFGNLGWAAEQLPPMLPGGVTWNGFLGDLWLRSTWLALFLVIGAAGMVIVSGRGDDMALQRSQLRLVGLSAVGLFLVVLPLLFPAQSWATPRIWYLPHAALALGAGALIEAMTGLGRRAGEVLALVTVVWAAWVLGGVSREARLYVENFRLEVSMAEEIAVSLDDGEQLLLLNPPWTFVPGAAIVGEHIAPAFATDWTSLGALRVLTTVEPSWVTVARDRSLVCRDPQGVLFYGEMPLPASTEVFDAANRQTLEPDSLLIVSC